MHGSLCCIIVQMEVSLSQVPAAVPQMESLPQDSQGVNSHCVSRVGSYYDLIIGKCNSPHTVMRMSISIA